jgi:hypothetical protein
VTLGSHCLAESIGDAAAPGAGDVAFESLASTVKGMRSLLLDHVGKKECIVELFGLKCYDDLMKHARSIINSDGAKAVVKQVAQVLGAEYTAWQALVQDPAGGKADEAFKVFFERVVSTGDVILKRQIEFLSAFSSLVTDGNKFTVKFEEKDLRDWTRISQDWCDLLSPVRMHARGLNTMKSAPDFAVLFDQAGVDGHLCCHLVNILDGKLDPLETAKKGEDMATHVLSQVYKRWQEDLDLLAGMVEKACPSWEAWLAKGDREPCRSTHAPTLPPRKVWHTTPSNAGRMVWSKFCLGSGEWKIRAKGANTAPAARVIRTPPLHKI